MYLRFVDEFIWSGSDVELKRGAFMGMSLVLYSLSDVSIERVLSRPALLWTVLAPDDPELLASLAEEPSSQGFFARLFGSKKPEAPRTLDLASGEVDEADLDKAWHGVHFLLTGRASGGSPPLDFLLEGGREAGEEDFGYGPARVFRAVEVHAIHAALRNLTDADLSGRFNPAVMTELDIYPSVWDRESEFDENFSFLLEAFLELQRFIREAAERNVGVVIVMQ